MSHSRARSARLSRRLTKIAACAILTFCALPLAAHAAPMEIRAAVGLPPAHPVVEDGWRVFQEVATRDGGGDLSFRLFVYGALIGPSGGIEPLARGEADMGFIAPSRFPEQFPFTGYLTQLALVGDDGLAASAAMTELLLLHCPPCSDEFLGQNLVFLGTYSAAPYVLMSKQPIGAPPALQGRQVYAPGSLWDRWVAALGAYPVQHREGPGSNSATRAPTDAVIDVASTFDRHRRDNDFGFLTRVEFGAYRGASPFTANRDFWNRLTVAQRKMLFAAAAAGLVAATRAYDDQTGRVLAVAQENGLTVVEPDPELSRVVRAFADQDGERAATAARDREGIVDAAQILQRYRELYAKYATLFDAAPMQEQQAGILMREIYGKLDPEQYAAAPAGDGGKALEK